MLHDLMRFSFFPIDEPVSEVNLLLHIQSFQWLSVYFLSMNGLVYF